MFWTKMKTASLWAVVCIGFTCAAIGGAFMAPGFAQPGGRVVQPISVQAPVEDRKVTTVPVANKDDFRNAVLAVSHEQKSVLFRNHIIGDGNPNTRTSGLYLLSVDPEKPKRTSLGDSTTIGFVPKSTLAYSVNWGDGVVLWDTRTHAKVGDPIPHALREDTMPHPAFSPDGEIMVTRSELDRLRFWDVKTRKPITDEIAQRGIIWTMQFSRDGKWLFSESSPREFNVYEARTGKPVAGPLRHDVAGWYTAYFPKTQQLATVENGKATEADVQSDLVVRSGKDWEVVRRVKLPGLIREVKWIDETHLLIVGDVKAKPDVPGQPTSMGRNQLYVVNLGEQKPEVQTVLRDARFINSIEVAPDGKHFSSSIPNGDASCWKLGEEKPLWTAPGGMGVKFGVGGWVVLSTRGGAAMYAVGDGKELWRKEGVLATRVEGPHLWVFSEAGVEISRPGVPNEK